MHITNTSQAKANLSHLIKVLQENTAPRKLGGSWEGKVTAADDFDSDNENIAENFYNSNVFPDNSWIIY